MEWKEVSVEINFQAAEVLSNIMNELGSGGVVNEEKADRVKVTAYYYDDGDFPGLLEELKNRIDNLSDYNLDIGEVEVSVNDRCNEDWSTSWHQYFKPLEIGEGFLISPSWEEVCEDKRKIIKIDPGMAFGIGGHETTQMCVRLLEKYMDYFYALNKNTSNSYNIVDSNARRVNKSLQDSMNYNDRDNTYHEKDYSSGDIDNTKPDNMLDIGTGTGILAIAAAYLGVRDITGIDIDPAAVEAARENIKINQVEDNIKIIKGDMTENIAGTYSIITANLLPDLIVNLLPSVPPLMDNTSILILSGIIMEKRYMIIDSLNRVDLDLFDEDRMGEWVSLVAVKKRVN
ncbi:MAG: 50S ribosomal protein L11 methyltransferase [Halanaerobiales bacterium]